MITYDVKYKRPGGIFWKKIKKVKGDGFVPPSEGCGLYGMRWFVCDDETRIEIPATNIFVLSRERFLLIKERMENEAGQSLKIAER